MVEGEEGDRRFRGGSEGEGDGDRGRLKRKGLVGLEESSAPEPMARRLGW